MTNELRAKRAKAFSYGHLTSDLYHHQSIGASGLNPALYILLIDDGSVVNP